MPTIRAVVFDLDGTLIDSAPDLRVAVNKLLAEHGRPVLAIDEIISMIGDGAAKLVERAFDAIGGRDSLDDLGALTTRFLRLYEGHTADLTRPYPGLPETLARLRAAYPLSAGDARRIGVRP